MIKVVNKELLDFLEEVLRDNNITEGDVLEIFEDHDQFANEDFVIARCEKYEVLIPRWMSLS